MLKYILFFLAIFNSQIVLANNFFNSFFHETTYSEPDTDTSLLPAKRPKNERYIFIFSPKTHAWAVYNKNGERIGLGHASGGKDYCADIKEPCRTVEGEYTIFRSEDSDCTSKTFPIDEGAGAPMPHCMFFYKGYAIHGSKNVGTTNASHGCIRVTEAAAEWMNTNYLKPGSLVIVQPYV